MAIVDVGAVRVKLLYYRTLYSQSAASITMGSLAAYLRANGFSVDLLCLDSNSLKRGASAFVDDLNRNIVIAKPNFKDFKVMLPLLSQLKLVGGVRRVFLCGPFAKANAADIMQHNVWLDGVVIGQPEVSAENLIRSMSSDFGHWNMSSAGCLSRDAVTGVVQPLPASPDPLTLSALPFPSRDVEQFEDVAYVNIEASRGCEFACSFCHVPFTSESVVASQAVNMRDPVLVVDEMERLRNELGKSLFIFNDSCFWSTKKDNERILRFCSEITQRNLNIRFYIYLKGVPFIEDHVLRALVKAGLVRVFMGIENSVRSTLKTYRKKIPDSLYETVKTHFDELGVNIHIGFITVEPHSALDDVLSNIEYLFKIGKLFRLGVILEPVRAVPGTALHNQLIKEGLLSANLPFGQITYGYRFVHPEVGEVLAVWQKLLRDSLKKPAGSFEYCSTTGELLRVIAERVDSRFNHLLTDSYKQFNAKKLEGMRVLLDYFRASIDAARQGNLDSMCDSLLLRNFERNFTQIATDLAILHSGIVAKILENGGARIVAEVYAE